MAIGAVSLPSSSSGSRLRERDLSPECSKNLAALPLTDAGSFAVGAKKVWPL